MNHKVLLADDSLTIQKVIKITLANQPYDITDCMNEEELFHKLSTNHPKLVFLDFNLSEKYTGYELTTKIKSLSPSTKVLLLLGTFDTVDEVAMEKCGASDKIVKPFDSNKFIAICKQLIETFADEDVTYPESKAEQKFSIDENPEDQWTVSHTTEHKFAAEEKPLDNSFPGIHNPLIKEMSDWGMNVPDVINESGLQNKAIDLPPIIGEVKSLHEHKAARADTAKYQTKFPETNDLDYPTMDEPSKPKVKAPSKLLSIDDFKEHSTKQDETQVVEESDVSLIQAQIKDEIEDNLWQADEFEDLKKEVSAKTEEAKNSFHPTRKDFDESLFKPLDDGESIDWPEAEELFSKDSFNSFDSKNVSSINMSDVRGEIEQMVKKYVKEYMDELFQKNTEKVAWEVIPDLAENLIRQELSKISNKILNEG